jgi:membrane protein required for colicin V production
VTWVDYAVLAVLALSIVWGLWRGLVREVISLAGWVMAFLAANLFAEPLAEVLPRSIPQPELRVIVAFVAIFVVTLTLATLAAMLLAKALKAAGLGGLDRTLGGLFGVARAALIVLAFALVAGLTSLPRQSAWTQSWWGPVLGRTMVQLKPWLPPPLAERLRYH